MRKGFSRSGIVLVGRRRRARPSTTGDRRLLGAGRRTGLAVSSSTGPGGDLVDRARLRPATSSRSMTIRPSPAASSAGPNASTSPTSTIEASSTCRCAPGGGRRPPSMSTASMLDAIADQLLDAAARGRRGCQARRRPRPAVSNRSGKTPMRKSRAAASSACVDRRRRASASARRACRRSPAR